MPARASSSSDWPLPATPATPTISPRRTVKLTPRTRSTPRPSFTTRSVTSSSGSPAWPLVHAQAHGTAHHELGELLRGRRGRRRGRDNPSLAHCGHDVGDLADL